jgi:hypothetical protein
MMHRAVEWINSFSSGVMIWRSPSLLWMAPLRSAMDSFAAKRRGPVMLRNMEDEAKPLESFPYLIAARG